MTRETKIGLLVGLAFIIVIGILLSDHMTSTTQPPQAPLTSAADNVRDGIATPASRDASTPRIAAALPVVPQQEVPTQQELADRGNGSAQRRSPVDPIVIRDGGAPSAPNPAGSIEPQPTAVGPQAHTNSLQEVARHNGEELVDRYGNPITVAQGAAQHPGRPREYKAEAGDSLSKLAARFLGSNTRTNRELIIKANPALQQDPNKIVVGRTYIIPDSAAQPPAPAAAPIAPVEARSGNGQQWYTVKENDNLWKIAEAQLGSGNAWVQIKELNKEVLKNGETVRVNMRLRLPAKPVVSASAN